MLFRLLFSLTFLVLLETGVFFVYQYFQNLIPLTLADPAYAITLVQQVSNMLLIVGSVATFFCAITFYLLVSGKKRAQKIASTMIQDVVLSREQFKIFFERGPVPYLLVTRRGEIQKVNLASVRFLGNAEAELVGKNVREFLEEGEGKNTSVSFMERIMRGMPVERREMFAHTKGSLRWVLLSAERLGQGGDAQTLITLVDIHEQKELERIKTEFLSLASHQLRTPLANLKWYIDFLRTRRKEELTPSVSEYLDKMYRRNEDMIDLVNTLLNLSRIEMGRVKVEKESADLVPVVRGVVEELEAQAKQKNISVDVVLSEKVILETDPRLVRIIVQNLLANAFRYTKEGGAVHILSTKENGHFVLSVQDTGVGIPLEEQGKIFSKMFRATNAKNMEANGNGIGLYMCKALADALGGDISFTSEPDKGTTFSVSLPW